MAGFFKSLVELGEEKSPAPSLADTENLGSLSKSELIEKCGSLQAVLKGVEVEHEKLKGESITLRNEYDAYKRKVEKWEIQMREARQEDKKIIDELRGVASGKKSSSESADEVVIRSLNDSIDKLKEQLRSANAQVEKATRKQLDTEEARRMFEEAKQKEIDALLNRVEEFKSKMKSSQLRPEMSATVKELEEKVAAAEKRKIAAEARERELQMQLQQIASGPTEQNEFIQSQSQLAVIQSQLQEAQESLLEERTQSKSLREQLEQNKRKLDDFLWEKFDWEKKLAEARAAAESANTKLRSVQTALESTEEHCKLSERNWEREKQQFDQNLANIREKLVEEDANHAAELASLKQTIEMLKGAKAERDEMAGEAEMASQRLHESLEAQRRQFEAQNAQLQRKILELDTAKSSAIVSLEDVRDDVHRKEAILDELRLELETQAQQIIELENQLAINHRTVMNREDDVLAREREKQQLKHQVETEKQESHRIRQELILFEQQLATEREKCHATELQLAESKADKKRVEREMGVLQGTLDQLSVTATGKQKATEQLESDLKEQQSRAAEVLRVREELSAKVRGYEDRVRELDRRLAAALRSNSQTPPVEIVRSTPSAILSSAFTQHRISWAQSRVVIIAAIFFILFLAFLNYSSAAPGKNADLVELTMCREALALAKKSKP